MNEQMVRVGYSRTTSVGSRSIPRSELDATIEAITADPEVVNAFYYLHPSGPATWIKGTPGNHAALSHQINEASR